MSKLISEDETFQIRGAVFEVYREMGCGFLEAVYQECLAKEMHLKQIPFVAQQELVLQYKGEPLEQKYKPDFICFDRIIVELKAVKELTAEHRAQIHNYLKATGLEVGLLVNFGHSPKVEIERIVNKKLKPFNHGIHGTHGKNECEKMKINPEYAFASWCIPGVI
jgi:GxxExxY protein